MICEKCKKVMLLLGSTIGATKLYGCPTCKQVKWDPAEYITQTKAEFGSIPDQEAARDPVAFLRSVRGLKKE